MKVIVQKFGGTSVSSPDRRKKVSEKVKTAVENGYNSVVVVSAMGRCGDPYATDTLLNLVDVNYKNSNLLAVDLLLSCGEIISTVVLCNELIKEGINAIPLTGGQAGIFTNDNFSKAVPLRVDTERIISMLNEGKVPVIAGFQGQTEKGHVTTLGRGGSDTSAALIGAALQAERIEIYTDVDGIMTADPRIVSEASLIKNISYNEVFQLADQGAKVIHPGAVEIASRAKIPMIIKNTLNKCEGTTISEDGHLQYRNIITAITHSSDRVQISLYREDIINKNCCINYTEFLNKLAVDGISIDLINIFPNQFIFTINTEDVEKFSSLAKNLKINFTSIENCSKIAIIGSGMRGVPGVMARILKALTEVGVEVLQTADSYSTIWCLVKNENTENAINSLHKEFFNNAIFNNTIH